MEVHQHNHSSTGTGHRKKWTHYLWEFLMLFLAVFCGFLAEYQLEHKIEKNREHEYVESLVKDFEYDTAQYNRTIKRLERKIPFYDSVLLFLKNPASFLNKLPFRFYIKTNLEVIYTPLEPTMQQLKGSGNLRLIRNKLALDSILIYDSRIGGSLLNQNNYVVEFNKRLITYQETIFDDSNFNLFLNDRFRDDDSRDPSAYDIDLFTRDPDKIMVMHNLYVNAKATDVFSIGILKSMNVEAADLIALIKKEYHLK